MSLLGFIFSFIAKSKALAYRQTYGMLEGKAKVDRKTVLMCTGGNIDQALLETCLKEEI